MCPYRFGGASATEKTQAGGDFKRMLPGPALHQSSEALVSSIWIDLLFLHGHIHDMELARRLVDTPIMPPPSSTNDKHECDRARNKPSGGDE